MEKEAEIVRRVLLLTLLLPLLSGCLFWGKEKKEKSSSPEELYTTGEQALFNRKFGTAKERFKKLLEASPESEFSRTARLGLAEAYFRNGDYEEAAQAYKDYLDLHPLSPNSDYVQYKLGMCYYKLMLPPDRDQKYTQEAIKAFEKLIKIYPTSPWAIRGAQLLKECKEGLAQHDIYVGKFYYKVEEYKAAQLRFQAACDRVKEGESAAKALYWLGKTYEILGKKHKAIECYQKVVKEYGMWGDVDKAEEALEDLQKKRKRRKRFLLF
jgi:outer membrane protein assembly factor BamD